MRGVVGGRHELCIWRGEGWGGEGRHSKPPLLLLPPPAAATRYLEMRIALYVVSSEFVISSKNPLLNSCEPLQSQDIRVYNTPESLSDYRSHEKLRTAGKDSSCLWKIIYLFTLRTLSPVQRDSNEDDEEKKGNGVIYRVV
ncbi:LOW QUALITY PROTEIN: hypothetical protein V1478_008420 [Vespula squamosa]|uniref:Uncharacterized protein n=1 Tax=Vespula squamosa TaxID=30214 RepID=A0ABD2AU95_VESSQ